MTVSQPADLVARLAVSVANAALMQYHPADPFFYDGHPLSSEDLAALCDALHDCHDARVAR